MRHSNGAAIVSITLKAVSTTLKERARPAVSPAWLAGLAFGWLCVSAAAEQMSLRHFGQADGLANQAVTAITQDGEGYLWVGTENGLFRFDGARFQRYGKRDLLELRPGAATGAWQSRYYFSEAQRRSHPELGQIGSIAAGPDGALWMGCGRRVCRSASGVLTRYGPQQGVPPAKWGAVFAAKGGEMWFRSQDYMLSLAPGAERAVAHAPPGASDSM